MKTSIKEDSDNPVINIVFDTLNKNKQALVFFNTKKSAEKAAEDIAKRIKKDDMALKELASDVLKALPRPTRQCERAALCVAKGIAFHHSGLTSRQRNLVEENFRKGTIKIICCTPTLAYGLDLPAYRAIIKDLRRFSQRGLTWIPVLEYLQICGRAGRPSYDSEGQAIAIAATNAEKEKIIEKYINGEPEEIYSKLAVEPVLRMHVLSLIASDFTTTKKQLIDFFRGTFYAHQFKDIRRITTTISKIIGMLDEWEFIIRSGNDEFQSADETDDEKYKSTLLGKRVAELYIDPLTAYHIISCIKESSGKKLNEFSVLQMISHTDELRPLLKVGIKEHDYVQEELLKRHQFLLEQEPSMYEPEYDEFLNSVKTALMFDEWVNEKDEDFLLEKFNITPGETRSKIDRMDWMLYATSELCKLLHYQYVIKEIIRLRLRVRYGIKEELLSLVRLQGIGRVRARMLFRNKIKDLSDVKNAELSVLKQLLGEKIAVSVKNQVGQGDVLQEKELENAKLGEWE
ncbi:hypothetical protein HYT54_00845 [Candidatus Woesearchaeota archaeon]|nr:hypothetical protein [Candidatus Woesearchaeota archaeon]